MSEHIRIGDIRPRVQYVGNGAVATFPFPFPIFADTDLTVFLDSAPCVGGYVVSGAGQSGGGNVTFAQAPAPGAVVTLSRAVPIARTTDFQDGGAFRAGVINEELDRLVCMVQQVREELDRTVRRSLTSVSTAALDLPEPAPGRALKFGADGALAVSEFDPDAAQTLSAQSAASAQAAALDARAAAAVGAATVEALCAGYVADARDAAVLAEEARDATLAAFDSFDDRYLGAKAEPPTLDNDGDPLQAGALHFSVAEGAMKLWTGSAWVSAYVQGGDFIERDRAWPIGSVYVNAANATNPALLLGFGTWSAIGQGRVLVGAGTGLDADAESRSFAAGATGGTYAHRLTEAEMPAHTHSGTAASAGAHTHSCGVGNGSYGTLGVSAREGAPADGWVVSSSAGAHTHALSLDAKGGGGAHANLQPYLAVYMWVRTA